MTDLLDGLDRALRITILTEATRLLALLPAGRASAKARQHLDQLLSIRGREGQDRLRKGDNPLAVMLLTRPLPARHRCQEIDWLRAWVLVGALRFCVEHSQTDRHARVALGTRVIRLICSNKYKPDPLLDLETVTESLESALGAVRHLMRAYEQRAVPLVIQIQHLELLLRNAHYSKPPKFSFGRAEHRAEAEHVPVQETRDGEALVTLGHGEPIDANAPPEDTAETLRPLFYDFDRSVLPFALACKARQLELIEAEDRDNVWVGEFAALTAAEMRQLYREARAEVQSGAALIAASLVSGRALSTLAGLADTPSLGGSWKRGANTICFAPDVTASGAPETTGFGLTLPFALEHDTMRARAWLAARRFERGTHIARLARALPDAFARQGEDAAIAALLSGTRCADHIPLYYASFRPARLQASLQAVLRDQFGAYDAEAYRITPLKDGIPRIGSVLSPNLKAVKRFFLKLIRDVDEARRRAEQNLFSLVDIVTTEINLAASILSFQTARRPWRAAFEPWSQITGRKRLRVRLEGKGNRQVEDGRIVPLAQASRAALALYQGSLRRIEASGICAAHGALARRISETRAGHVPMFFAWDALDQDPTDLSARRFTFDAPCRTCRETKDSGAMRKFTRERTGRDILCAENSRNAGFREPRSTRF